MAKKTAEQKKNKKRKVEEVEEPEPVQEVKQSSPESEEPVEPLDSSNESESESEIEKPRDKVFFRSPSLANSSLPKHSLVKIDLENITWKCWLQSLQTI